MIICTFSITSIIDSEFWLRIHICCICVAVFLAYIVRGLWGLVIATSTGPACLRPAGLSWFFCNVLPSSMEDALVPTRASGGRDITQVKCSLPRCQSYVLRNPSKSGAPEPGAWGSVFDQSWKRAMVNGQWSLCYNVEDLTGPEPWWDYWVSMTMTPVTFRGTQVSSILLWSYSCTRFYVPTGQQGKELRARQYATSHGGWRQATVPGAFGQLCSGALALSQPKANIICCLPMLASVTPDLDYKKTKVHNIHIESKIKL